MKLREILGIIRNGSAKIGICYVGDKDYVMTTKQNLIRELNEKNKNKEVKSISIQKNKNDEFLGIKIFKNKKGEED